MLVVAVAVEQCTAGVQASCLAAFQLLSAAPGASCAVTSWASRALCFTAAASVGWVPLWLALGLLVLPRGLELAALLQRNCGGNIY
jgi:hypothetical protein